MSVYFVMTSNGDKQFKWIHRTAVHWNIDRTNQARNQNHLSRVYFFIPISSNICSQPIRMLSVRYRLFILFFEQNPNLYFMSSVVKLMLDAFLKKIMGHHRIRNRRNNVYFIKYYFIPVHNKTILNKINVQTVFDEMWYIVEYLIMNIFSFLILFYCEKSKMRIICIHHLWTL